MIVHIVVDDDHRPNDPTRPWSAYFMGQDEEVLPGEAGLGATVQEAVADLLANDMSALDLPDESDPLLAEMERLAQEAEKQAGQQANLGEVCDCCNKVRQDLPYHHDNHNPPYDGYDYCEICYGAGCGGPGDCEVS